MWREAALAVAKEQRERVVAEVVARGKAAALSSAMLTRVASVAGRPAAAAAGWRRRRRRRRRRGWRCEVARALVAVAAAVLALAVVAAVVAVRAAAQLATARRPRR